MTYLGAEFVAADANLEWFFVNQYAVYVTQKNNRPRQSPEPSADRESPVLVFKFISLCSSYV